MLIKYKKGLIGDGIRNNAIEVGAQLPETCLKMRRFSRQVADVFRNSGQFFELPQEKKNLSAKKSLGGVGYNSVDREK